METASPETKEILASCLDELRTFSEGMFELREVSQRPFYFDPFPSLLRFPLAFPLAPSSANQFLVLAFAGPPETQRSYPLCAFFETSETLELERDGAGFLLPCCYG